MTIEALTGAGALLAFSLLVLGTLVVIAPRGVSLDDLFKSPMEARWPRGIQEEEPVHWRLDRLTPRRGSTHADGRRSHRGPRFIDRTVDEPAQ